MTDHTTTPRDGLEGQTEPAAGMTEEQEERLTRLEADCAALMAKLGEVERVVTERRRREAAAS